MIPLVVANAVAAAVLMRVSDIVPRYMLAVAFAPIMKPILGLYPTEGRMASPLLLLPLLDLFKTFAIRADRSRVSDAGRP